jgi:hypothetical protein
MGKMIYPEEASIFPVVLTGDGKLYDRTVISATP